MKIPLPFWCYFLPMAASGMGWIPRTHPVYTFASQQLLPVCLSLLLIGSDLRALRRLGTKAVLLMLAGAGGTVIGGVVSFLLYRPWLPEGSWGAVGALTGSWIGGSANLMAVKEALSVPDSLIGPVILIDAGIAYSWMALLIASSALQAKWERWISPAGMTEKAGGGHEGEARGWPAEDFATTSGHGFRRPGLLLPFPDRAEERGGAGTSKPRGGLRVFRSRPPLDEPWVRPISAILLAIVLSLAAQWAGRHLPAFGPGFTSATWTILLVTTVALVLSFTPLSRLGSTATARLGTWALYALLVTIGARADWTAIWKTPVFFALGLTWILIHGVCLLLAGYLLKASLGLIATASQANIGGPVSAPIVGATFSPVLAGAGLLMAILGNLLGTYAGLSAALFLHRLSPG